MDKLIEDLRAAAEGLRTVARGLRTPLDTSAFDRALNRLEEELKAQAARTPFGGSKALQRRPIPKSSN